VYKNCGIFFSLTRVVAIPPSLSAQTAAQFHGTRIAVHFSTSRKKEAGGFPRRPVFMLAIKVAAATGEAGSAKHVSALSMFAVVRFIAVLAKR
jgi:hypothetical protein